MTGMQTVTAATIGGAVIFDATLALLGRLKLALSQRIHLGEGQIRRLLLTLNIALVPLVLLSGILLDIYGARPILVPGSAMLTVGLLSVSQRPTYPRAFASILVTAFGVAALGTASPPPVDSSQRPQPRQPLGSRAVVVAAPKPEMPIAKGLPGPGLLVPRIVSKCVDHLPRDARDGGCGEPIAGNNAGPSNQESTRHHMTCASPAGKLARAILRRWINTHAQSAIPPRRRIA